MIKHKCSYPSCKVKSAKTHIQAWGDVHLCDKHTDAWHDFSLMPMRNSSDYKKMFEAEFKFSIACGASKEYQKKESEFIKSRLRSITSKDFVPKEVYHGEWLKPIQKILNELKIDIKIWPISSSEEKEEAKKSGKDLPDAKYDRIKCAWCNQMIPKNGAAQFSHLKKHINEVVQGGKITEEEAKGIRSVKLDKKHIGIFKKFFKKRKVDA